MGLLQPDDIASEEPLLPNATTRLTNGQRLEVNGTTGTVTILP